MKYAVMLTIVLCCTLIGYELHRKQKSARDIIGEAHSLCLHMAGCVRYLQPEPEQIISTYSAKKSKLATRCAQLLESGSDFALAWQSAAEECAAGILGSEELALVISLGSELGRSDTDSELQRLGYIAERLDYMYCQRRSECESKGRVYVTSGFLTGLLIMIFMI